VREQISCGGRNESQVDGSPAVDGPQPWNGQQASWGPFLSITSDLRGQRCLSIWDLSTASLG